MVTFVSYVAVDMRDDSDTKDYFADGTVTVSRTKLTVTDGDDKAIYYGSFTLAGSNQISGGTITGIDAIINGKLAGTFRNTSVDVEQLATIPDTDAAIQRWLETFLFGRADSVTGSIYADVLYGWSGNDTVKGLSGNDRLIGGNGADKLYGGAGKDFFDLNKISESGVASSARDIIADFVRGTDKIDLASIDANTGITGNNAFTKFIASSATFTAAGQLRLTDGVLYGNIDGDSSSEFSVRLTGVSSLSLSDIVT